MKSRTPILRSGNTAAPSAFSLIELLVVISIISLLTAILMPALARGRIIAKATIDLSNLRQIGIAIAAYHGEHQNFYPMHSSSKSGPWPGFDNRPRWADYIFPYVESTDAFSNPLLSSRELEEDFQKPFAHDPTIGYGGYGYNYQYLGNSRFTPSFHARHELDVRSPSDTIVIGDTAGSRGGNAGAKPGGGAKAVYVLDPPLPSARRAHPDGRAYYASSSWAEPTGSPQTYLYRSFPAERVGTDPGFSFADGHAAAVSVDQIDDHNKDGIKDNGYWNGHGQRHYGPPLH